MAYWIQEGDTPTSDEAKEKYERERDKRAKVCVAGELRVHLVDIIQNVRYIIIQHVCSDYVAFKKEDVHIINVDH